jgi:hypothetical protein
LLCAQEQCYLGADEVIVLEMYRFKGEGNMHEETVVYGIESIGQSLKGILLNSNCENQKRAPTVLSRKVQKLCA